jgi:hypothetical protein
VLQAFITLTKYPNFRIINRYNAMKKLFTLIVIIVLTISIFAQSPQKMTYQAVIRNASGALVANHAVGMKISLLQGSASGTVVFAETYSPVPQTNANGLVTIEIGSGTPSAGTFSEIDWSEGPFYLKTETDPAGGNSYTITGTSQVLSVPYSLYSEASGTLTLPYSGNTSNSNYAFSVSNLQGSAISGVALSITGTNSGVYGESIKYGVSGKATGTTGRAVSGEALASASIGVYGKALGPSSTGLWGEGTNQGVYGTTALTTGKGIYGKASSTTGVNYGVYGEIASSDGYAVYGKSTNALYGVGVMGESSGSQGFGVAGHGKEDGIYGYGGMVGVEGRADTVSGIGVKGWSAQETAIAYGVYGSTSSSSGYGVYGVSPKYGVYGKAFSKTGVNYGVYGEVASSDSYAVYGKSTNALYGAGVMGESSGSQGFGVVGHGKEDGVYGYGGMVGVEGRADTVSGIGVKGWSAQETAIAYGVYGSSLSSSGYGVYGQSPKYGIYGESTRNQGRAVMGEALSTGSIGVYGKALEDNCTGVWAEGSKYDFLANGPGIDYGTGSSIRWKTNVIPIPEPLEKIAALRGVFFDWSEAHGGKKDIGMIAEEVGKVLPEIVAYEENGVDAYGMDYSKITPLLLEAIKEQQKQIDELKAIINNLIANLSKQVNKK